MLFYLDFHLLGKFHVKRNTTPVTLPTRKAESLLAYLALHPQQHPREKLSTLFWGDSTDASARHSLNVALNTLRKAIDPDLFITTRTTVQLNPDVEVGIDAVAVENLARIVASKPDQLHPISFQFLINDYADLLTDFYDDWILSEREHYRALYLDTLLSLAQHQAASSNYPAAIELAKRVLTHDPANERAHQQLMFCYIATGERQKALVQYERCLDALRTELAIDEPSPETAALYDWIRQTATPTPGTVRLTNLPIPLTSFIGRENELQQVKAQVTQSRLVTLTGAGGSGKTRFAVQIGTQLLNLFRSGVWWIDLAPLSDPTRLAATVSRALGFDLGLDQDAVAKLLDTLRTEQRLLIFDNCEHLLDSCAALIQQLLQHCPDLKILATSREPLNLTGEIVYIVPTLTVPDPHATPVPDTLVAYEAVRLFVERAQAVNAHFTLNSENAVAVTQICARLDGIPLAIELAAARAHTLTASEIAARLDDRFALLTRGARTALPRQQTLHALIEWSYNLLNESERAMFRTLSIFAGGFTLDAVKFVCDHEPNALDVLTHLVEKSLVVRHAIGETTRYTMLETIREFANRELQQAPSNAYAHAAARHLNYFYSLGQAFEREIRDSFPWDWLDLFFPEVENMQAGLARALSPERLAGFTRNAQLKRGMELVLMLWLMWLHRGANVGTMQAFGRLLELKDLPPRMRLRALELMIFIARSRADWAQSLQVATEMRALAVQVNNRRMYARALEQLAVAERDNLNFSAAMDYVRQASTAFQKIGVNIDHYRLLMFQAETELLMGNLEESKRHFEQGLVSFRANGDKGFMGWGIEWLGNIARLQGQFEQAGEAYRSTLAFKRAIQDKHSIKFSLDALAQLAVQQEQPERAVQLYAAAAKLQQETAPRSPALVPLYESLLPTARAQLGEECFTAKWSEGMALTLDQAIALALQP